MTLLTCVSTVRSVSQSRRGDAKVRPSLGHQSEDFPLA